MSNQYQYILYYFQPALNARAENGITSRSLFMFVFSPQRLLSKLYGHFDGVQSFRIFLSSNDLGVIETRVLIMLILEKFAIQKDAKCERIMHVRCN